MRRNTPGDSGVALVAAMLVMGIVAGLSLLIVSVAIATNTDSGRDRQRTIAISAAEAGVDTGFARVQNSGKTPPCNLAATIQAEPDVVAYAVAIEYFDAGGTALSCPPGGVLTLPVGVVVAKAVIRSTATTNVLGGASNGATRRMEAQMNLIPKTNASFDKAIFADGAFSSGNQTNLIGNGGPNADIYSKEGFTCSNNQSYAGAVYSLKAITMNQTCTIRGDVWARLDVTQSGNGALGGRVLSSQGKVTVDTQSTVVGVLTAKTTVSWPGKCTADKCKPGATIEDPPAVAFPILNDTTTIQAFQVDGGYTSVISPPGCTGAGEWIRQQALTLTGRTVVKTSCAIDFSGLTLKLKNDLAIFASGGFKAEGTSVESTDAVLKNMHWIVPANAATAPCATPGIVTNNQFQTSEKVSLLLYSPCSIYFENRSPHIGQVYSGTDVFIQNNFDLQYRPLPVFGVVNAGGDVRGYALDIIFKREF